MKIGIAGHGIIGSAFSRCFSRSREIELHIYDKFKPPFDTPGHLAALDACDVVFVIVPTPYEKKLRGCDTHAVEEIVRAVKAPLCIKSTVPPGTTERLAAAYGRKIAFSPEFMGESADHRWPEVYSAGFVVYGGDAAACAAVRRAYELASPVRLEFVETSPMMAEMCKYMLNTYLAAKVTFVNQFYEIAEAHGLEYEELRRLFLLDPRVGESHTRVTRERGFGGKCLPKDLHAMIDWASPRVDVRFLRAIARYNDVVRKPDGKTLRSRFAVKNRTVKIVQAIKSLGRRRRPALDNP
jgi:UDPglucose 6-dehydrogenase